MEFVNIICDVLVNNLLFSFLRGVLHPALWPKMRNPDITRV